MKELLQQLVALQGMDLEIDLIENSIKAEQETLDARIATLAAKEEAITVLGQKLEEQKKESRTLEAEAADKMEHVRNRQSKMMQVQTGRDQQILLKEIEDAKKDVKENEDKIVALMESIETMTKELEERKNLLKGEKKILAEETKQVRSTIESIDKGRKSKDKARAQQAKQIKPALLKKYDTLRQRRKGLAVVNVDAGVCQGCFMAIPPQRYNMLLRGDQFFQCPTCQRIIYYKPNLEE